MAIAAGCAVPCPAARPRTSHPAAAMACDGRALANPRMNDALRAVAPTPVRPTRLTPPSPSPRHPPPGSPRW
jgi:hypothetical protein